MSIEFSDYVEYADGLEGTNDFTLGNLANVGRIDDGVIPFNADFGVIDVSTLPGAVARVALVILPPGRYAIFPALSFISTTDTFAATADGHLGHGPYVQADGTVVARDDDEWINNADIGAGALSGAWSDSPASFATAYTGDVNADWAIYDAADGLVIEYMFDTADSEASTVIRGWVVVKNLTRA